MNLKLTVRPTIISGTYTGASMTLSRVNRLELKNEKGDLVTDSYSNLARWRNHFSQLVNVYGVNDVRQTEIHTAEPVAPEPSAFGVELAIEKRKSHKSPSTDQIPTELIKAGGRIIHQEIHKLIISIWNKEGLPEKRK